MSDQPEAPRLADELDGIPLAYMTEALADDAATELRRLQAENEDLKRTLAASCDEERNQLWEAGPGGGCSRALSAEFRCAELLEALRVAVDSDLGRLWVWPESARETWFANARAAIAKAEGEKT